MKTTEEWIVEIRKYIATLNARGRRTYYNFSVDMTEETANAIKAFFSDKYDVTVEVCPLNKWDIIITWH